MERANDKIRMVVKLRPDFLSVFATEKTRQEFRIHITRELGINVPYTVFIRSSGA